MTRRQTKFERRDVNDSVRNQTVSLLQSAVAKRQVGEPAHRKTKNNRSGGLSWRCLAVSKNFRNRRRKLIDTRAGNDDAIAAAVSFLGDTQEPAALIFPELDVEVLALNLQFSRLDDVIHFCLKGADFGHWSCQMEEKSAGLKGISY